MEHVKQCAKIAKARMSPIGNSRRAASSAPWAPAKLIFWLDIPPPWLGSRLSRMSGRWSVCGRNYDKPVKFMDTLFQDIEDASLCCRRFGQRQNATHSLTPIGAAQHRIMRCHGDFAAYNCVG
jgi:hypothetical protein